MSPTGSRRPPYVLRDHKHAMSTLNLVRDERGVSFPRMAAVVGATRQQVGEWLRCWTMPASHRLFEMAHALGYDLALVPREDA